MKRFWRKLHFTFRKIEKCLDFVPYHQGCDKVLLKLNFAPEAIWRTAMEHIGFIGTGKLATGLAIILQQRDYPVTSLYDLNPDSSARLASRLGLEISVSSPQQVVDRCQLIFITTPDDVIQQVTRELEFAENKTVVHCSGAVDISGLDCARNAGAATGSMHPLQAFPQADSAVSLLPQSLFGIEGDEKAVILLERLVSDIGGSSFIISPRKKPLYHAAAVFVSNYQVTLASIAQNLFRDAGMNDQQIGHALRSLQVSTQQAIDEKGVIKSLTGPIERGDVEVIKKHLEALKEFGEEEEDLYRRIGQKTIPIALDKGAIDKHKAKIIFELLKKQPQR